MDQTTQPSPWTCTLCNRTMHPATKTAHLRGKGHAAQVAMSSNSILTSVPPTVGSSTTVFSYSTLPKAVNSKGQSPVAGVTLNPYLQQHGSTSSSSKWTCTVCDRIMDLMAKAAHLRGKKHVAQAAVPLSSTLTSLPPALVAPVTVPSYSAPRSADSKGDIPVTGIALNPSPQRFPSTASSSTWTCTVCDRIMDQTAKAAHLGGKKHASQTAILSSGTLSAPPAAIVPPSLVSSGVTSWRCIVCKHDMHAGAKESHLAGKEHARRLSSQAKPNKLWHCTVCRRSMELRDQAKHLCGVKHAKVVAGGTWALPIVKKKNVGTGTAPRFAQKASTWQRGHTSDPDFTQDDARDILYDIDTQWGMMPQGGAYKESDHYYA